MDAADFAVELAWILSRKRRSPAVLRATRNSLASLVWGHPRWPGLARPPVGSLNRPHDEPTGSSRYPVLGATSTRFATCVWMRELAR